MNRKQLKKLAEKLDLQLDEISGMDAATEGNWGCRWTVRNPGMAAGSHFATLAEVDDYLSIVRGGQDL